MAVHTPNSGASVRTNAGKILQAGNVADTAKWSSLDIRSVVKNRDIYGSQMFESVTAGVRKSLSSGNFAKMVAGEYTAFITGTKIAGVSTTFFTSPSTDKFRKSIHFLGTTRRYHITSWNAVTGAATKGGNAGDSYDFHNTQGGSTVDDAAHPTRSVPGELVYMTGKLTPVMDDYKAINGV